MIFYICFPTQNWTADIVIVSLLFCFVVIFGGDCCLNSKSDCAHTHLPPTHTHTLSFKWIEEEIPTKREEHDCFFPIYWLLVHLFVNLVPANDSSFKTISQKKIFFFSNVEKKRWRRQINIETIKINKVKTKKKIFSQILLGGWDRENTGCKQIKLTGQFHSKSCENKTTKNTFKFPPQNIFFFF